MKKQLGYTNNGCVLLKDLPAKISAKGNVRRVCLWRCSCGKEFEASLSNIVTGSIQSCGCKKIAALRARYVSKGIFEPKVTVLQFSGGTGSGCLAEMLLNGDLSRPKEPLIFINADPGMENSLTYPYVEEIEKRCQFVGIPFLRVKRNLYEEILNLKRSKLHNFPLPPFWTKDPITGAKGKLLQKCTAAFKIDPSDRALRQWMQENLGISAKARWIGENIVRKFIGFTADEWMRIKESRKRYAYFEYPLIDRKMSKQDVEEYYRVKLNRSLPARSVCNACFANNLAYFKEMAEQRPADFEQACLVDDIIRDLRCLGIKCKCYVSSTLIPLRQLAQQQFEIDNFIQERDDVTCHSGYCFV